MTDKKELKEKYKELKPDMGVYAYKCLPTGNVYLGVSQNVNAEINKTTFQLNFGGYVQSANLQSDWEKYGQSGFEISVLERLEYGKDASKTDYADDLQLLRDLCAQNISNFKYIK